MAIHIETVWPEPCEVERHLLEQISKIHHRASLDAQPYIEELVRMKNMQMPKHFITADAGEFDAIPLGLSP